MANRPTIQDVAKEAGVSVATVDRVLNGRMKVREETARRVYDAALGLGYHAAGLIGQRLLATLPEYRLGFILHKEKQSFSQNFQRVLCESAAQFAKARIVTDIIYAEKSAGEDYAALLAQTGKSNHAIAACAIDHPEVTRAVKELKANGIPCFALFNDFAQGVRESYVGLNNLRLGRMVAWMISRVAKPGKVALFVGGHRWHGHELRETGFRSYFREYRPDFHVLDTLINLETRSLTYETTLNLLDRQPDLTGLYCAGGGMEGAIRAVREVRQPEEVAFVVNEDTEETRKALQDRYLTMVNVTPLQKVSHTLMQLMVQAIEKGPSDTPGQFFLPQEFLFPEII